MTNHALHEALSSLSPTTPNSLPLPSQDGTKEDLNTYISTILTSAKTIIDSIPSSTSSTDATKCSEWKLQSTAAKNNGFELYKLNCKDGKGNWFGRRSIQRGIAFARFKRGLQKEFGGAVEEGVEGGEEKAKEEQGVARKGSIRGIGVERKVEGLKGEKGAIDVYHLKAQFPGPSAPRDFITACITSDKPLGGQGGNEFTMVSRPLRDHPETEVRKESGFVRGEYESIEFVREIDDPDGNLQVPGENSGKAIEWIMITRSNPGGNVPKFLVERGTPGSIVEDAKKFLNWVEGDSKELLTPRPSMDEGAEREFGVNGEPPKEVVTPGEVDERELSNTGLVDDVKSEEEDGGVALPKNEETPVTDAASSGWLSGVGNLVRSAEDTVFHLLPGNADAPHTTDSSPRPPLPHRSTSNASYRTALSTNISPPPSPPLSEPSSPTSLVPTPSTSSISLTDASPLDPPTLEKLSEQENALFQKHQATLSRIQQKATEQFDALDAEERALSTSPDGLPIHTPLDSPTLTKEQKNLLKKQIRIKDKRKKLQDRLERDVRKESRHYEKEVEKLRDRAAKNARREKEREEKELRKRIERADKAVKEAADANAAAEQANAAASDAESERSIAQGSQASGGLSRSSLSRRLREMAGQKEEELRNVVRGLTEEVVELRRTVGDLEEEVVRLRRERDEALRLAGKDPVGPVGGISEDGRLNVQNVNGVREGGGSGDGTPVTLAS
ncbi:hypothetical protein BJ508DRAFT_410939 [Ascobolus immersus RN42]|uniref:DUF3074 domain-containing protein n=1 Tax=Ascobolus immersus RN42 TaxID=1160509 RepID=A0A3N4IKS8_ASCIM|nr:hypothetical protein BJ508DRAFT_410939 [Ascobolus immersus RN42]